MNWEKAYNVIKTFNWVTLLILGLTGFFLLSPAVTLGIILGGLIIILNFSVLQHTIRYAFGLNGLKKARKRTIIAKYYLRFIVMGIVIFALVSYTRVDPIGLAVGLSTVLISIVSFGIYAIWKRSSEEII